MYIAGEVEDLADHNLIDFMLVDYKSHPAIKAPLSN
jgi:thymidylate synthase